MPAETRPSMWKACAATAVVAAVAITAACAPSGGSGGGVVKVGMLANLTGPAAQSFGVPFSNGFQLALSEAKPALDKAGVQVDVVTEDAKSAVASAVTGYNKLRAANVPIVLQDSQSPLGQAVAPLANDDKIALLSGAGSKLENKAGYAFRFTDLGTPTLAMGSYLRKEGAKRVGVVVASDNPSFATLADATEAGLPGGYVSKQRVSVTDSDFSAVLANLRKDRVDALVLSVLPAQAGNIMLQMKQAGGFDNVKVVGTVATSEETYKVADTAAKGFVFPQVWAPGAKGGSAFEATYDKKYGAMPTAYGALGYQVGWITVEALIVAKSKGAVTGTSIRDALPAASHSTLVTEHGILDLKLDDKGAATSTGVLASFDDKGGIVTTSAGN